MPSPTVSGPRRFARAIGRRARLGAVVAGLLLAGCAAAPTQEMSDARLALDAARAAGAADYSPLTLRESGALVGVATRALSDGDYARARRAAEDAWRLADRARRASVSLSAAQALVASDPSAGDARRAFDAAVAAAAAGDDDLAIELADRAAGLASR